MNTVVSKPSISSAAPESAKDRAHHAKGGKGFINPWDSYAEWSLPEILGLLLKRKVLRQQNNPDTTPPTVTVRKPSFLPTRETPRLRTTWLGHACFLVEFPNGLRVLFDPVFEERCSPFSFLGPRRYTPMPCQIADIPIIDAVVISHSHYDHLSLPTVREINKLHPNCHFFASLGLKSWFDSVGITNSTELDWWQSLNITLCPSSTTKPTSSASSTTTSPSAPIEATLHCLPSQHTSGRTPFNKSATLWASWSITAGATSLYFAGDTGYRTVPVLPPGTDDHDPSLNLPHCPAFAEIGLHRGPFDVGLIPIGAYDPRFIMSAVHCDPVDSVDVFVDTKCRKALGMHWGTWVLTEEEVMEPPRRLGEEMRKRGLEGFGVCEIGESREW